MSECNNIDLQVLKNSLKNSMIRAAREAGNILCDNFEKKLEVREKPDAGLVTDVDIEAERVAVKILKHDFPDFGLMAEESAPEQKTQASSGSATLGGRWIIDPLDGTTNFVHGYPMFCVSIAAELDGEIIAGVIFHPILNDLYVAIKDQGAFVNDKQIFVSKTASLDKSLLTTGFTYKKGDWLKMEMDAFKSMSGLSQATRRPGSAALDLAYVARGVFDGFWERNLSPWDVAAGSLLVQEAGGVVSDFAGQPLNINTPVQILAANSAIHGQMLGVFGNIG